MAAFVGQDVMMMSEMLEHFSFFLLCEINFFKKINKNIKKYKKINKNIKNKSIIFFLYLQNKCHVRGNNGAGDVQTLGSLHFRYVHLWYTGIVRYEKYTGFVRYENWDSCKIGRAHV